MKKLLPCLGLSAAFSLALSFPVKSPSQPAPPASSLPAPIVITGADRRPAQSLNGEWHVIPDPYRSGLYDFHEHEIKNGWFVNEKRVPGDSKLVEYDFAAAPTLHVPGDWNSQNAQ